MNMYKYTLDYVTNINEYVHQVCASVKLIVQYRVSGCVLITTIITLLFMSL